MARPEGQTDAARADRKKEPAGRGHGGLRGWAESDVPGAYRPVGLGLHRILQTVVDIKIGYRAPVGHVTWRRR